MKTIRFIFVKLNYILEVKHHLIYSIVYQVEVYYKTLKTIVRII